MKVIVPRWFWDAWIEERGREPQPSDVPDPYGLCTEVVVADDVENLSYESN